MCDALAGLETGKECIVASVSDGGLQIRKSCGMKVWQVETSIGLNSGQSQALQARIRAEISHYERIFRFDAGRKRLILDARYSKKYHNIGTL